MRSDKNECVRNSRLQEKLKRNDLKWEKRCVKLEWVTRVEISVRWDVLCAIGEVQKWLFVAKF